MEFSGKSKVSHALEFHYYMFYKPFGCVTAHRDARFPVVMDYFRHLQNEKLSPVGRLDRETEGLLLVTDDGAFNQRLIHPAFHVPKTYEFMAMGELDSEKLRILQEGVMLIGASRPTQSAQVNVTGRTFLKEVLPGLHPAMQEKLKYNLPNHPVVSGRITITEGRKRQIRRMLKVVGCCVIFLKRVSIGDIVLDPALCPGEFSEWKIPSQSSISNGSPTCK